MDAAAIASQFGFPALCLCGLAWAGWCVIRWLAPRLDKLIDAHDAYISDMGAEMKKQTIALQDIREDLRGVCLYRPAAQQDIKTLGERK